MSWYQNVGPLGSNGEHLIRWELQMKAFAGSQDASDILSGKEKIPVVSENLFPLPESPVARRGRNQENQVGQGSDHLIEQAEAQQKALEEWEVRNASVKLAIIGTIPEHLIQTVRQFESCHDMFQAILDRYRHVRISDCMRVFKEYHEISASSYKTVTEFITEFRSLLNRARGHELSVPDREVIFRLLNALQPVWPDYCQRRRAELRRNEELKPDFIINEIREEASWQERNTK